MPLFMRSNVAVILRTSAVVRPPPLIQACRPTGPCNSGGKKKKYTPRQRLPALSRGFTLDIWRNKVTLVVFHGRTVLVFMAPFRNMNSSEESIYFYAENGPFLLCYSENTKCGGARPLSSLYVSGTTNGAPTRDRSIVLNGLITPSTHTRKTALSTSEQYSLQVATSPPGHSKHDSPLTIDAFHPSLHLLTTYISNVPIFQVLLGSCIHK